MRALVSERRPRGNQGLTLLEIVIAMAVLAVALFALMSSIMSASSLHDNSREKVLAYNAARQAIEAMRNTTFAQIYTTYRSGPNNQFTVTGLNPIPGVPVGQIFFPADSNGAIREDFYLIDATLASTLGMTSPGKDLNGDGAIDSKDHSQDYKILPVMVRVQWQGTGGKRAQIEVATFITVQ
jgi:prepilin-type N-terminal cleavage/methylation domain-containing protein